MKLVVIGANGQLGTDLLEVLSKEHDVVGLNHTDIEITEIDSVKNALSAIKPAIVLNTAAYHIVPEAEKFPAKAFQINGIGTMNLASAGPPRVRVDSLGAWKVSAPEGCRTARTAASPGARSTARSSARGSVALPRVAGCCATIASSVSAPSGMKSGGRPGTTDPTARPLVVPRTVQSREYDLFAICVYLGSPLMVTLQTAEPNNGHSPNRGTNAKGDALAGHQLR